MLVNKKLIIKKPWLITRIVNSGVVDILYSDKSDILRTYFTVNIDRYGE